MRALLDVNVLIALFDAMHVHHGTARHWLDQNVASGWASCPITQNGCLRILSSPAYPRAQPLDRIVERLKEATGTSFHEFWSDDLSVLDPRHFTQGQWMGSRQITDVYLLGLAAARGGRLVTLDRGIDTRIARSARSDQLLVL